MRITELLKQVIGRERRDACPGLHSRLRIASVMGLAGLGFTALFIVHAPHAQAGWARLAPYDGICWQAETPLVRHEGAWRELVAIDGTTVAQLREASLREWGSDWRRRFDEDIVEVLDAAGAEPGATVALTLRDPGGESVQRFANVTMTHEKRQSIMRERRDDRSTRRH